MAGRPRRLLAAALVVVVVAAVVLSALRFNPLATRWPGPRRGYLTLYAVVPGRGGNALLISNASFSVWAFYPTPRGTALQGIFNGTGGLAYVNLSSLINWSRAWTSYYGPQAVLSFMPSLIVFVSYPIEVNSTTVEVVSQQEMVPLNLSVPLSGRGLVVRLNITSPLRFYYRIPSGVKYYGSLGLARAVVGPGQTTTTTASVPVTATTTSNLSGIFVYAPKVLAWYPSNDSLGPISLAIVAAEPTSAYGASLAEGFATIILGGARFNEESFDAVAALGGALSAAAKDAEVGAISQAMSALSPVIPGATLTFTQASQVFSAYIAVASTSTVKTVPDIEQIFILGQVALINWTIQYCIIPSLELCEPLPLLINPWESWWQIGIMPTAVQVVKSGGAMAPALYSWEAHDTCVSPSTWAQEYEAIEFEGLPPYVAWSINQSCPIPNTPAPVDWMDYNYNLTLIATLQPAGNFSKFYVNLEVNGGESPMGVAIDAGSALISVGAAALIAAGIAAPEVDVALVLAALMSSVNFVSYSYAMSANVLEVQNFFTNASVYTYISNLTPLYTSGSLKFTLPRELLFINALAP